MPIFRYTAKDTAGKTLKGKVEAPNSKSAANELHARKLLVISLSLVANGVFEQLNTMLFGVKSGDIVNFTRQLATMISAGLPLANALSILSKQRNGGMSTLVTTILQDIEGGSTLADALAKHPKQFGVMYIQLVKAGELGGVLDNVLLRLADNMEKAQAFKGKTIGAMIYPIVVILAMLIVGSIMMIFVIPKMLSLYKDFDAELPLLTRLLMNLSNFFVNYWWLMMLVGVIGGFVVVQQYKSPKGRLLVDNALLHFPLFGSLIEKSLLTEFARTLSLLLGAGVSLLQALQIVTDGVSNKIYQGDLKECISQVEKGIPLSQAISQYEEFPPILQQMMSVGEETGKLEEVLHKLSVYFETETEQAVKNLMAAIEPAIMVVLGVGVGLLVVAIIMPIYNLTSQF